MTVSSVTVFAETGTIDQVRRLAQRAHWSWMVGWLQPIVTADVLYALVAGKGGAAVGARRPGSKSWHQVQQRDVFVSGAEAYEQ